MIGKYKEKRDEREEISDTKAAHLRTISDFLAANMELVEGVEEIQNAVQSLKDLERESCLRNQNQYLDELSSLTEVSVSTLKRIKHEGGINANVWNTPGKKRPHKPTVSKEMAKLLP